MASHIAAQYMTKNVSFAGHCCLDVCIAIANAGPAPSYLLLFPPFCSPSAYLLLFMSVYSNSRIVALVPAFLLPFLGVCKDYDMQLTWRACYVEC